MRTHLPFAFAATLVFCGCTFTLPGRYTSVEILSYNVQNLFDDTSNGNEYEEFDPARSRWSTAEYQRRLQDLSRVIRDSTRDAPDVIALQEIEHVGVLEDLRDRYLGGLGYVDLCAIEPEDSPIVVGLLSRFPIRSASSHGARIDSTSSVRPMLEVELDAGITFRLVVCHWKSKSGGAAQTEPYRIAAAEALASLLEERIAEDPGIDIVVVGDLNEQPDEYRVVGGAYPTALVPVGAAGETSIRPGAGILLDRLPDRFAAGEPRGGLGTGRLYSPWLSAETPGSYWYRGVWERIDHALLSASCFDGERLEFTGFSVVIPDYAVTAEGAPLEYSMRTATGYSDHLPILVSLEAVR